VQKIILLFILLLVSCKENDLKFVSESLQNIDHTLETDRSTPTRSRPTGENPSQEVMSCKKFCKKNHFLELEDDGFYYLGFTNFGYRGIGRCRGHALLTQKMTILARFNDEPSCDLETPECLDEFKDGIKKITSFQTHTFKGFKNLLEFSSHPKILPLLRNIVAGTSNRYKAGPGYIKNPEFESEQLNTFYEIKRRISLGQLPYVGVLGTLTGAHALVTYHDTYLGDQNILCAKDPNFRSTHAQNCENYFFEHEGEIYFQRLGRDPDKMLRFNLTNDEDSRVKRYQTALSKRCLEDSRQATLCK